MRLNRELASRVRKNTFIKQLNPIETWQPNQSMRNLRREKELVSSVRIARKLRA